MSFLFIVWQSCKSVITLDSQMTWLIDTFIEFSNALQIDYLKLTKWRKFKSFLRWTCQVTVWKSNWIEPNNIGGGDRARDDELYSFVLESNFVFWWMFQLVDSYSSARRYRRENIVRVAGEKRDPVTSRNEASLPGLYSTQKSRKS